MLVLGNIFRSTKWMNLNHFRFFILEIQIRDLLENLIAKKTQKTENIHLIGFSLGAHLMGIVGKKLKDAGKAVSRITGTTKSL